MKRIADKKGYSLIELIIVIGLIGLISVPLMLSFTTGLGIFERESKSNDDVSSLREFQIRLNEEVRSASIGQVSIAENTLTINNNSYVFNTDRIIRTREGVDDVVVLNGVQAFVISDILMENEKVRAFNISITVNDHKESFTTETFYKLRGE